MIEDAISVIGDTSKSFGLYMAHICRRTSQSAEINKVVETLKAKCISSKGAVVYALMIADFKMKFETLSSRESTIEHFGKRSIGWHGYVLVFFLYKTSFDKKMQIIINDDGTVVRVAKK